MRWKSHVRFLKGKAAEKPPTYLVQTANNDLINDIREAAKDIQAIYSQAETLYTSAVDSIIQRKSKDEKEIQHVLNYMLDFADNEKILDLYRKLCRYYFEINPQAIAEYIQSYKEVYDADESKFKSGYFKKNPIKIWDFNKNADTVRTRREKQKR